MIYGIVSFIVILAIGMYFMFFHHKQGELSKNPNSVRSLKRGEKAKVVAIQADNPELTRRLRELGLVPGTVVEMRGFAPLKDPVAIKLKGYTLSLRNQEADQIIIEKNN